MRARDINLYFVLLASLGPGCGDATVGRTLWPDSPSLLDEGQGDAGQENHQNLIQSRDAHTVDVPPPKDTPSFALDSGSNPDQAEPPFLPDGDLDRGADEALWDEGHQDMVPDEGPLDAVTMLDPDEGPNFRDGGRPPVTESCFDPNPGPVPPLGGDNCSAILRVESVNLSSPSCWVDEEVSHERATLVYPCTGGEAHAVFGSDHFTGTVDGTWLQLCLGTIFPYDDGCTWLSAQQIYGHIDQGVLTYSYTEHPRQGEIGCAGSCTATGEVLVE